MVKNIAIIPARGGSKRIKNKNIIDFKDKPLIAWTIEAAIKSNIFHRVIVSTDSDEIKQIALKYGAEVPFMRQKTADDHSPVSLATLEALEQSETYFNETYHNVVQLMANCPMRDSNLIIAQFTKFLEFGGKKSLLSAFSYGMFNPFWAHEITSETSCRRLFGDKFKNTRSQDLPKLLCPSGATWISTTDKLKQEKSFYSKDYYFFETSWLEAIDIDDYEDLKLAKVAYEIK